MPFCRIMIKCNVGKKKLNSRILFVQRNMPPGYHKGSILNLCMCACIFRSHRLDRKQSRKRNGERGNKMGENGKCKLFVLVRMAQLTSNASISHGIHLSCKRQRSFYVGGKKKKHIRLRNIARLYPQFVAGVLLWQGNRRFYWCCFFTPSWLLLFYIHGLCALTFSVFLLSLAGKIKSPNKEKNDLRQCRESKKETCMCVKERWEL